MFTLISVCTVKKKIHSPPSAPLSASFRADHNALICFARTRQVNICGADPRVAVFTSGCINSVSCCSIWIMKAVAAEPLRAQKRDLVSLFLTCSFWFCPLNNSSHVVLTPWNLTLSITPVKLEHITMAHINSPESQVMLMLWHGTRKFMSELI